MTNKNILKAALCICALISTSTQANIPANAKLSLNKNDIKVWTYRDATNAAMSYKAETTLNVPIEQAVALVLDVEHSSRWAPYVAKAEILSRDEKKGEFTLYMVLDFPFPLKDRDLVVQGRITKDAKGVIRIQNSAIATGKAIQPDYVRLKRYQGNWTFQRLDATRVKVTTSGFADPEGAIPAKVANMFVEQQPYQMLQKMKAELAKNPSLPALPAVLK